MALRDAFKRLTTPVAEQDEQKLRSFCAAFPDVVPIAELAARREGTIVGEITNMRIVPRPDGSPWLEATVSDGTGVMIAMWTGRKRIAGVRSGRRLMLTGRGAPIGPSGRLLVYNPRYELL